MMMKVALCGLGAIVGYGLGRQHATLGVGGDDIEGKLKGIIAEQLGVDEAKVTAAPLDRANLATPLSNVANVSIITFRQIFDTNYF